MWGGSPLMPSLCSEAILVPPRVTARGAGQSIRQTAPDVHRCGGHLELHTSTTYLFQGAPGSRGPPGKEGERGEKVSAISAQGFWSQFPQKNKGSHAVQAALGAPGAEATSPMGGSKGRATTSLGPPHRPVSRVGPHPTERRWAREAAGCGLHRTAGRRRARASRLQILLSLNSMHKLIYSTPLCAQ